MSNVDDDRAVSCAGDYGEPRAIVPAPADPALAHLSWPKVARTPDGTLIAAYTAGRFHGVHGEGCPAVSVSTDGGRTFGPPHILKRYTARSEYTAAGNMALGIAEDGAVVLLSMAFNGDKSSTIDGWRSTDSGRTWREADVSTLDHGRTGSVYGHVLPVPGRGLAVFGHYRAGSRTHTRGLWMAWSHDSGRSWGPPRSISPLPLVEPAFTFHDGRFIGLVRPAHTPGYYTRFVSGDLGETWTVEERGLVSDFDGPVALPSPFLAPDPGRPGRLLALVSERYGAQARGDLLGRIVLCAADARELKWRSVGELARFPKTLGERRDITYPWMTPLGGGEWFAVFYCGRTHGPAHIYGLVFKMPGYH